MITIVQDLLPMMTEVDLYGSSILDELTLNDCDPLDTVLLLDHTARIEMCSNYVDRESVSLIFDAHIGQSHYFTYRIEIPIFIFYSVRSGLSNNNNIPEHKNRIVLYESGMTVCEGSENYRTIVSFYWHEIMIINKYILGENWKYWIKKCGYDILYRFDERITYVS